MSVRTRFAPSPTGFLHIGGLRTALYNFLFAKQNNGTFILRIEDTDQNRLIPNASENLIKTLFQCGLKYDETPYIQSERLYIYKKHLNELINKQLAYPCFFSSKNREDLHPEFNLDKAIDRMNKEQYVVKFKMQSKEKLTTYDEIRGKITFDLNLIDDPIILKSDGFPTYHFANVIDDHHMNISHVIRGEEWLPSLPKHILIYNAFGWDLPKFCHLPLLLNTDKSKLSKRQGDVAVEDFLKKGYLKECLINFVALLGWHPANDREIFSLNELIQSFSLDRINKSGAIFDVEKLNWMNKEYIKNLSKHDMLFMIKDYFPDKFEYDEQKLLLMLEYAKPRVNTVSEIVNEINCFLVHKKVVINNDDFKSLSDLWINELKNIETISEDDIKKIIDKTKDSLNIFGKNLYIPLRMALIGKEHGPDLYTIINILGKKESIDRLQQ